MIPLCSANRYPRLVRKQIVQPQRSPSKEKAMIEVHAFSTPNSVKVPVALEEMGIAYELKPVNVRKGEQKADSFLSLNANGKVEVLVDPHGPHGQRLVLTESAAILIYLAEKSQMLLPTSGAARARVFEQLVFHASGVGPAFGQSGFFQKQAAEHVPFAIARFSTEANRLMTVLNGVLATSKFTAADEYTIADIAHFGWLWRSDFAGIDLNEFPHAWRWYDAVVARPAVARAIERVTALVPQAGTN
jgi:GSH-dependent disulfide-bond oxidoreductase